MLVARLFDFVCQIEINLSKLIKKYFLSKSCMRNGLHFFFLSKWVASIYSVFFFRGGGIGVKKLMSLNAR